MPDPCQYDLQASFLEACIPERQTEHPDESPDQSVAVCVSMWQDRECSAVMPDEKAIYKAGQLADQSAGKYKFVMSTPAIDSYGDTVEQVWRLNQFKANPIALWMHDALSPVGSWEDVKVERVRGSDALTGVFALADYGSSEIVDMLHKMIGKVIRSCSVGFRPGKAEPLDEKNPWDGYRLSDNLLLECSVVSLPANHEALLQASRSYRKHFSVPGKAVIDGPARAFLSRARDLSSFGTQTSKREDIPVTTLADRIAAKQAQVNDLETRSEEMLAQIDASGAIPETIQADLDTLTETLTRARSDLGALERLEQAKAASVASPRPVVDAAKSDTSAPRIEMRQDRPKGHLALATIGAIIKGYALREDPAVIVAREARDLHGLDLMVRASTAPAVTGTAAWAGNLVEQTWGEFIELLRDESIYGRVPGMRVTLDALTNMPVQSGRGNLAGGFVGENGAIPVKSGSIGTTSLQPHKLAVISAYSKDLFRRRTVENVASIIRSQVIGDTAETIDTLFLDATARSAGTRPAGLRDTTETGGANINAATNVDGDPGNATVAEILGDVDALLGRVDAIKARTGAWVMNPAQVRALKSKQEATTGQFPFRDEVTMGMFEGYPIIVSTNVTAGIVAFVADGAMVFGSELAPMFEESRDATLHFENASPLAIGTAGSPATVAAPAINLFQQDLIAVKMTLGLDWRIVRQAGVQVLTGCTAW